MKIASVDNIISRVAVRYWTDCERGRISRVTAELIAAGRTDKRTSGCVWGFQLRHQADASEIDSQAYELQLLRHKA